MPANVCSLGMTRRVEDLPLPPSLTHKRHAVDRLYSITSSARASMLITPADRLFEDLLRIWRDFLGDAVPALP